ncbi:MAG: ABC transporter substrate-binding protein [Chloroflexi bacterium]|nr:ABC transporter substrate-binding protein [Chloroflexota bacterium]
MNGRTKGKVIFTGLVCLAAVLLSCAPQPAPKVKPPAATGPRAVQPPGWQQEWEKTLTAARRERNLSIFTPAGSAVRAQISAWFDEKFGLEIDWTPLPAAEITPKITRERQAGLHLVDIQMGALSRQIGELKPAGFLAPVKPLLVLPEVLDKKAWFGGDIPWADNDKAYTLNNILSPEHRIAINTELVKPDEITSYNDLLEPRWKGKIVMMHPVLNSRLPAIFYTIMGRDYLVDLARQRPVITENQRAALEWLAQGKYPVMIFTRTDELMEFIRAGAPIRRAIAREGTTLAGGGLSFSMLDRPPHPNAARIFVNWWMSKELGTLLSRFLLLQSARLDAPTDHLPPDIMRDPSFKYVNAETEAFHEQQFKVRDLSRVIFGHLLR